MGSPFKTPEFKKLFQEWNELLKQSGLGEIENFSLPEPMLKTWNSFDWSSESARDPLRMLQARDYYEKAEEILRTYAFKNERQRMIWDLHCDGLSVREIERELTFWLWDTKASTVHYQIQQVQRKSGLKNG